MLKNRSVSKEMPVEKKPAKPVSKNTGKPQKKGKC